VPARRVQGASQKETKGLSMRARSRITIRVCLVPFGFEFSEVYAVSGGVWLATCLAFYLASSGFHVNASTAHGPVQARIFHAVLPMIGTDAENLVDKLIANGLDQQHRADLSDFFRTQVFGDSIPMVLKTEGSPLCLAVALRYDIDQVMQVSPEKNWATEKAITTFLLAHEASHC
jgi:hypothetical protein